MIRVLAVKLTSCFGCLGELVYALTQSDIRDKFSVEYFTEIVDSDKINSADIAFVEGSVTTRHQEELLKTVRSRVEFLVALGTCALSGGVQSLGVKSNLKSTEKTLFPVLQLSILEEVKPVESIVKVDFAIPGCPVSDNALISFLKKYSLGGLPVIIYESVCGECKRKGVPCILVSNRIPCLGPITLSGCGALCPQLSRGCYGCYGLKFFDITVENIRALETKLRELGLRESEFRRLLLAYGYKTYAEIR